MSDPAFDLDGLAKLREPFPAIQIGKLPKGGIYLDFVGHGYLTARFLDVDPEWFWEPFALDATGLPMLDEYGGLWIRLTICGKTRIGYGDASGKKGPNAVKEAIGDALRNAGMRFGAALDLWCKGDPDAPDTPRALPTAAENDFEAARKELAQKAKELGYTPAGLEDRCLEEMKQPITAEKVRAFIKLLDGAEAS